MTAGDLGYLILFCLIFIFLVFRPVLLLQFYRLRGKLLLETLAMKVPCRLGVPLPGAEFLNPVDDQLGLIQKISSNKNKTWWLWGESPDFKWQAKPGFDTDSGTNIIDFRLFFNPRAGACLPDIPILSGEILKDGATVRLPISKWKKNEEPELSFWKAFTRTLTVTWALEIVTRIVNTCKK